MPSLNSNQHDVTTYKNGPTVLQRFRRVFDVGGELRYATSSELENGVLQRRVEANSNAAVRMLQSGHIHSLIADGPISLDASVFAANMGMVSAAGTREIGRALDSAAVAGDAIRVVIQFVAGAGGGGGDAEVILSATPLVGAPPAGAKWGYDTTNNKRYFVDGGVWNVDEEESEIITIAPADPTNITQVNAEMTAQQNSDRDEWFKHIGSGDMNTPDYVYHRAQNSGDVTIIEKPDAGGATQDLQDVADLDNTLVSQNIQYQTIGFGPHVVDNDVGTQQFRMAINSQGEYVAIEVP